MSQKHQEMANVLSIPLVNSSTNTWSLFGEQFDESTEFVPQNLWYEISNSSHIYMEFGTYTSPDKLIKSELSKYISDKSYEFDTADLVFGALTRICKYRVFIHQDKPEVSSTGHVGETFTNTIHLLHQKDHCHLLKLRNQNKTQSQSQSVQKG